MDDNTDRRGEQRVYLSITSLNRSLTAKVVCALLTVLVILGMAQPLTALAAGPKIAVESDLGYNGYIKSNAWGPLTVTLTSDQDISGELVVQLEDPYNGTFTSYVEKVDLTAGSTKSVQFAVVGGSYSKQNSSIKFYEGSMEKGDYIPFSTGRDYIQKSAVSGLVIGVLAADPDTMNFLSLAGSGNSASVTPLEKEDLPDNSTMLSTVDVIVMNDYPTDTLSGEQLEAIRTWVKRGGTLVLAGGQGYAKTVKGLEDLSPVDVQGGSDVLELDAFVKTGGEPLVLTEAFPVSSGVPKQGATIKYATEELPLIAELAVGKGRAIYAAYDISMNPVYQWRGHSDLWLDVLKDQFSSNVSYRFNTNNWNMLMGQSYILDYFPSLTFPPFSLLFWMLVLYAVVAAPLLYYVLKKLDRREWAWGLIPLIAITASAVIYFAGTSGRSEIRAHTLNIIELDGQGEAVQSTASALFVPSGGTYNLKLPAGTSVTAEREQNLITGGQMGGAERQIVSVQPDSTQLTLREMTTRSIAKLWMENPELLNSGQMKLDLHFDGQGKLQGTVENQTNGDFEEAFIVAASKVYALGELPKGKQIQLPSTFISAFSNDYGSAIFPYQGYSSGSSYEEKERERSMINQYMNYSGYYGGYVLLGWSKESPDPASDYTVNGKNPEHDYLNLWAQPFDPYYEASGEIEIPAGVIVPEILDFTSTEFYREQANQMSMSAGDITFGFALPADTKIQYSEIQLRSALPSNTELHVWNESKGEWETGFIGPASEYTGSGMVKVKYTTTEWTNFQTPEIMLKGEVLQ